MIDEIESNLLAKGFTLDNDKPELVLVFGGDGSLLRAFQAYDFKPSFLLINVGHLGFFSDYNHATYQAFIEDILNKNPMIEKLPLYTLENNGKLLYFVNDIALQSERTVELEVFINDAFFTKVRSSGIVVGSPVSSTGYLLSLGSPVVVSNHGCYQYAMIAPVYNRLFPNPINKAILLDEDVLKITIKDGDGKIFLDGLDYGIVNNKTLTFKHSKKTINLVHFKEENACLRILKSISNQEE